MLNLENIQKKSDTSKLIQSTIHPEIYYKSPGLKMTLQTTGLFDKDGAMKVDENISFMLEVFQNCLVDKDGNTDPEMSEEKFKKLADKDPQFVMDLYLECMEAFKTKKQKKDGELAQKEDLNSAS